MRDSGTIDKLMTAQVPRSSAVERLHEVGVENPVTGEERMDQIVNGMVRSAASVAIAPLESAGIVAELSEDLIADSSLPAFAKRSLGGQAAVGQGIGRLGNNIRTALYEMFPDTRAHTEFWAGQMPQAIGSTAGFAAGGLAGTAVKLPAAVGTMFLGASANAAQMYDEARAEGATDEEAAGAFLVGAGIGTTEVLGLRRVLGRLNQVTGGGLLRTLRQAAIEGFEEGSQEALQGYLNNVGAKYLYDEERQLLSRELAKDGAAGALTGVFMSLLVSAGGRSMPGPRDYTAYLQTPGGQAAAGDAPAFTADPNRPDEPLLVISDFSLTEEEESRAREQGVLPAEPVQESTESSEVPETRERGEREAARKPLAAAPAEAEDVAYARTSAFEAIARGTAPRGVNLDSSRAQVVADALEGRTLREALSEDAGAVLGALEQTHVLTEADRRTFTTESGQMTQGGADAVEAAVLGAVTAQPGAVAPNVADKMVAALPAMLATREVHDPFGGDVELAVDALVTAQQAGLSVPEALRAPDTTPQPWKASPVATALARALQEDTPEVFQNRMSRIAIDVADRLSDNPRLFVADQSVQEVILSHLPTGLSVVNEDLTPSSKSIWRDAPEFMGTSMEAHTLAPLQPTNPLTPAPGIVGLAWEGRDQFVPIDDRGLPGLEGTLADLVGERPTSAVDVIRSGVRAFERILPNDVTTLLTGREGRLTVRQGSAGRGRVPKGTSGFFHMAAEFVRMQRANDITTFTHEAGHAIHKLILMRERTPGQDELTGDLIPKKAQAEILELAESIYGGDMPAKGLATEGWAHFMELWTLDPPTAQERLPNTYQWFEGDLLRERYPQFADGLDQMRELATRWRLQGAEARAQASIADSRSLRERMARRGSLIDVRATRRAWWESMDTIEQIENLGLKQGQTRKPFSRASLMRGTSGSVVRTMVEDHMVDLYGQRVGDSLKSVLAPTKRWGADKIRRFWMWMWAQRTLAMHGDYMPADSEAAEGFKPRETGLSLSDARYLVEELGNADFEGVASGVYNWSQGVLYYFAQASPHARSVVRKVLQANLESTGTEHGYYVPLQREFNELDGEYTAYAQKHGELRTSGGIARFLGSGRRVKPLDQALVSSAQVTVNRAQKEAVLNDIFYLAEHVHGMGDIIRKLTPDEIGVVPAGSMSLMKALGIVASKVSKYNEEQGQQLKQVRNTLGREARAAKKEHPGQGALSAEMDNVSRRAIDLAGETLTVFSEPITVKGREPVIQRYNAATGDVDFYAVNRHLYEELGHIEPYSVMRSKVFRLLGKLPRDVFALSATGASASFGLITNPTTDLLTSVVNTRYDGSVFMLLGKWFKSMGHAALFRVSAGRISSLKKSQHFQDPYLELFNALNLSTATYFGQDTAHVARAVAALQAPGGSFAANVQRIIDPRQWPNNTITVYNYLRDLISFPEIAARRSEMELVSNQIGWKPGQPINFDQVLEIGLAGRRVTVDFPALGTYVRAANTILPFFGPVFAGYQSYVRAARRDPPKFALRGLGLTAASLSLWWFWNKDDEKYRAMTAREKYGYWHLLDLPLPNGDTVDFRIRRPHEIGYLFGTLPEILMDNAYKQREQGVTEMMRGVFTEGVGEATESGIDWVAPSLRPPGAATAIELLTNTKEFDVLQLMGGKERRTIVPDRQQGLEPEEQYGVFTNRASIEAGQILGVSPRKIDHLIRGFTGSAGGRALETIGLGPERKRFGEAQDLPVFGVMFRKGGPFGYTTKYEQDLGEMYSKAIALGDSKVREETPEQKRLRAYLTDAWRSVRVLSTLEYEYAQTKDERDRFNRARMENAKSAVENVLNGEYSGPQARTQRKRVEREKKNRDRKIERDRR